VKIRVAGAALAAFLAVVPAAFRQALGAENPDPARVSADPPTPATEVPIPPAPPSNVEAAAEAGPDLEAQRLLAQGLDLEARRHWDEAEAHYVKMEKGRIAPIQAHLGRARVKAAIGDHEQARLFYIDVNRADHQNVEARIGAVREAHALGLDRQALPQSDTLVLDHPESAEARALQKEIHLSQQPTLEFAPTLQEDNGGNRLASILLAGSFMAEPQTHVRVALTGNETQSDSAPGFTGSDPQLDTTTFVAGVASHLVKPLSFEARAGAARQEDLDGDDRTFVIGDALLRWEARPTMTMVATTSRRPLLDAASLVDWGIRLDTAALDVWWRFTPAWTLEGFGELGRYSDGNARQGLRAGIEWRTPWPRPTLTLAGVARLMRYNDDRDYGYLDPIRYDLEYFRVRFADQLDGGRFSWKVEGTYGRQSYDENDAPRAPVAAPDTPVHGGSGSIVWRFADRYRLEAYHLRTNDAIETAPGFPVRRSGLALRVAL
jgi:hypothetical protein